MPKKKKRCKPKKKFSPNEEAVYTGVGLGYMVAGVALTVTAIALAATGVGAPAALPLLACGGFALFLSGAVITGNNAPSARWTVDIPESDEEEEAVVVTVDQDLRNAAAEHSEVAESAQEVVQTEAELEELRGEEVEHVDLVQTQEVRPTLRQRSAVSLSDHSLLRSRASKNTESKQTEKAGSPSLS